MNFIDFMPVISYNKHIVLQLSTRILRVKKTEMEVSGFELIFWNDTKS